MFRSSFAPDGAYSPRSTRRGPVSKGDPFSSGRPTGRAADRGRWRRRRVILPSAPMARCWPLSLREDSICTIRLTGALFAEWNQPGIQASRPQIRDSQSPYPPCPNLHPSHHQIRDQRRR